MSHFTVLVIGENIEKELAPFQENNMGDCPKQYLKFCCYPKDGSERQWFSSEADAKEKLKDAFDEDDSFWENPNAKWDWYQIGGRWQGRLKLKEGATSGIIGSKSLLDITSEIKGFDSAKIKDIDFQLMDIQRQEENKKNFHEGKEKFKNGEISEQFLECVYDIKKDETEKEFISKYSTFTTFAVIKDGKWYEKGKMGWWGAVANEKERDKWEREFKKLLETLTPETRITIVDCHI